MELSPEQYAIVHAPLTPLSVIACAGSGKTATAIHRLIEMRRLLGDSRRHVALLSFSNIAVNTFRQGYQKLAQTLPDGSSRNRIEIDTLDGFITNHILRPHAYRTMQASRTPFLVTGNEPFLAGFTCPTSTFPIPATDIRVGIKNGNVHFYYNNFSTEMPLDQAKALQLVCRLGKVGAYTHDLGRYWCYQTLRDQPRILHALAWRYPHLLIDESQDIGSMHQDILNLLIKSGVNISLIGDPNQGIYEFAGADGNFLRNYGHQPGVTSFELTRNYRSNQSIMLLANNLSKRQDESQRKTEHSNHGAFFITYDETKPLQLIERFQDAISKNGLFSEDSAILCRSHEMVDQLAGSADSFGQGSVKFFVNAAIHRDKQNDFRAAFQSIAKGIYSLLIDAPHDLLAKLQSYDQNMRELRRLLWTFTCDQETGLPSSKLPASSSWHAKLINNIRMILLEINQGFNFTAADNLGRKLTRTKLPEIALHTDEIRIDKTTIRVKTVHQVKGESIGSVLYIPTIKHLNPMLDGIDSELGRIGYVAVTRARDFLWIGVPQQQITKLRSKLLTLGLKEWP